MTHFKMGRSNPYQLNLSAKKEKDEAEGKAKVKTEK